MRSALQDLRFGIRMLVREKGFTAIALVTLALCIGANTTIFSVVNRVLLRPLPYPNSDRLVEIYNSYPGVGVDKAGAGAVDLLDRQKETSVFEAVTIFDQRSPSIGETGSPERLDALRATPSYFDVLQLKPMVGRPFTEEEGQIGHEKVVILTHGFWQERFAGKPTAVGQTLRVDGEPYEIVGVMPPVFETETEARLIFPMAFQPDEVKDDARHNNFARMQARLKPGVTVAQAQERIDALNARLLQQFPKYAELLKSAGFHTVVAGMFDEMVADVRPLLHLLQWGVVLVLLIGCVNVANLLLVRSTARMRELAIRFALGAGRLRVARQLLTESLLLGLVGGVLGLLAAVGGIRALTLFGVEQLPRSTSIGIDRNVLLFALGLSVVTGVVFGTIPVLHLLRGRVNQLLRGTGRTSSPGKGATYARGFFVLSQVALAFLLLIGAGLLIVSFWRVIRIDPGFRPEGVMSAQLSLPASRYKEDVDRRKFADRLIEAVRAQPLVEKASYITLLPFGGSNNASVLSVEGKPVQPGELPLVPHHASTDPEFFKLMGIPLLEGRLLEPTDTSDSEPVVVIDQALAKQVWPNESAIGKRVRQGTDEPDNKRPWCRIVGVVGSIKTMDLDSKDVIGAVYFTYSQVPREGFGVVVRGKGPETQVMSAVRAAVLATDPEMPIFDTRSMSERVDRSLVKRRAPMMMLLIFSGIALILSSVGIYGVLAYTVTQSTKEIGIRLALGASQSQVLGRVLWRGGRLVLVGLIIGAGGALALSRLMSSLLYEVKPTEPAVFVVAAVVLGGVGLLACLMPSLQATRVSPTVTLRYE